MQVGSGLAFELPAGWEASIDAGDGAWRSPDTVDEPLPITPQPDGSIRRLVAHLANFPLPAGRGDYGDGAIETMRSGDILIAMVEFDPASVDQPLFAADGVPTELRAADFNPDVVHVPQFGASGAQRFFSAAGRPFALYVVVGSHLDRGDDIPAVNEVLGSMVLT